MEMFYIPFVIFELLEFMVTHDTVSESHYYDYDFIPLTLKIEELNCNPSFPFVKCVLSELFSWVSYNCEMHLSFMYMSFSTDQSLLLL